VQWVEFDLPLRDPQERVADDALFGALLSV
jgi:hypothetical protein